ncbi:hypothetical protein BaRGS_00005564, partial [Batillaria attramentaria]
MGVSTVTAARMLAGQLKGGLGEDAWLSFDKFPHTGLSKTYSVNTQVTDSAASGTAYLCGVKTDQGMLGVDARAHRGNCNSATPERTATSILRWSADAGKSTGVVTTARVTHATPAAAYAHVPERGWEGDHNIPSGATCKDIAYQLIFNNSDINVIMGGGRRFFQKATERDPETGSVNSHYGRHDYNLIDEWAKDKTLKGVSHKYVWNATDFHNVDPANTDYLLGLFDDSHMQYESDRSSDTGGEPSLAEMTEKAIEILRKNDKGFFLLVEGERHELASTWVTHATNAYRALHDTLAFADAVQRATEMLDSSDSLIVTTADHSHTFVLAGYGYRGNPILGKAGHDAHMSLASDHKPYTPLLYGTGPGFDSAHSSGRPDLSHVDTTDINYQQEAAVPMSSETHGGEDVAIYARGPMAHLFTGVHEQNYIPHVMAFASCVGAYSDPAKCAASLQPPSNWQRRQATSAEEGDEDERFGGKSAFCDA